MYVQASFPGSYNTIYVTEKLVRSLEWGYLCGTCDHFWVDSKQTKQPEEWLNNSFPRMRFELTVCCQHVATIQQMKKMRKASVASQN